MECRTFYLKLWWIGQLTYSEYVTTLIGPGIFAFEGTSHKVDFGGP